MHGKKLLHYSAKISYIFALLFSTLLFFYFYVQAQYIKKNEQNYIHAIQQETKLLIKLKKQTTFNIAKNISLDKKLILAMKNEEFDKLYDDNFFATGKKFKAFENLGLHIVDKNGINRYLSWTKNSIGKYILNARQDLNRLYHNPRPMSNISVGKFDLTFKGIMPIYDAEENFLGVVEVITHFNSISKHLAKDNIYTALVIDKRFSDQLEYPYSDKFIDGYNISTLDLHKGVEVLLKKEGIDSFIKGKKPRYLEDVDSQEGYYVTCVAIKSSNYETIGSYVIFIADINKLHSKIQLLHTLMGLMSVLFFIMSFLVYRAHRKNLELIELLNIKVLQETQKNLKLIYNDSLTDSYKKEKFLADTLEYENRELVMLNIRNFSQINSTYGFSTGDEVLRITAKKLQRILEQKIYRIDSDEFVFISDNIEHDIFKIQRTFKESSLHIVNDNINLRISFSFSAVNGGDSDTLRKLTIALKQAKNEPFKPFVYYQPINLNDDFIRFNGYLYDAIFSEQDARIIPFFQGIRNNSTGEIVKYEALARLEVNTKIYTPYFFIDIAKNSGFLFEITKIMIDKSLDFLAQQDQEITISINITEEDLLSKQLKDYLLKHLEKHHLKPQRITLEILEGVSSNGTKNSILQLKELKELGFKLAIDDFGVEYSNFERINELEIDFIKIDGKYIKNIDTNHKSYKITKAIKDFATSMNIEVVAEFVENESIQAIVEEIGIDYSQGYYFSKPGPKIDSHLTL